MVNISDRTDFTCQASGYPLPQVIWSREDTEGPGLTVQQGVIELEQGEQVAGGKEGGRKGGRERERGRERGREEGESREVWMQGKVWSFVFQVLHFQCFSFIFPPLSPSLSSSLPSPSFPLSLPPSLQLKWMLQQSGTPSPSST